MNNPLKDLDQIKVSEETKKKTLSYVLEHKKKKNYFRWSISAITITACMLFMIIQSNGIANPSPSNRELITYVSIDINPSIQFTLDNDDKIIEVTSLNDDANKIIKNIDFKNKMLQEALPILFDDAIFKTYLEDGIVEVGVYSSNTNNSSRIEKYVNDYLSKNVNQGSYHCGIIDQKLLDQAKNHHVSLGKFRVIDMILKYDDSKSIEQLKQLSMKELYLIVEKYDSSAVPANCHQDSNKNNGNQGHGKRDSSSNQKNKNAITE